MTSDVLIVAIDGPSGVGKSTVARKVAQQLGIPYLSTGAMYRALALQVLDRDCSCSIDLIYAPLDSIQ